MKVMMADPVKIVHDSSAGDEYDSDGDDAYSAWDDFYSRRSVLNPSCLSAREGRMVWFSKSEESDEGRASPTETTKTTTKRVVTPDASDADETPAKKKAKFSFTVVANALNNDVDDDMLDSLVDWPLQTLVDIFNNSLIKDRLRWRANVEKVLTSLADSWTQERKLDFVTMATEKQRLALSTICLFLDVVPVEPLMLLSPDAAATKELARRHRSQVPRLMAGLASWYKASMSVKKAAVRESGLYPPNPPAFAFPMLSDRQIQSTLKMISYVTDCAYPIAYRRHFFAEHLSLLVSLWRKKLISSVSVTRILAEIFGDEARDREFALRALNADKELHRLLEDRWNNGAGVSTSISTVLPRHPECWSENREKTHPTRLPVIRLESPSSMTLDDFLASSAASPDPRRIGVAFRSDGALHKVKRLAALMLAVPGRAETFLLRMIGRSEEWLASTYEKLRQRQWVVFSEGKLTELLAPAMEKVPTVVDRTLGDLAKKHDVKLCLASRADRLEKEEDLDDYLEQHLAMEAVLIRKEMEKEKGLKVEEVKMEKDDGEREMNERMEDGGKKGGMMSIETSTAVLVEDKNLKKGEEMGKEASLDGEKEGLSVENEQEKRIDNDEDALEVVDEVNDSMEEMPEYVNVEGEEKKLREQKEKDFKKNEMEGETDKDEMEGETDKDEMEGETEKDEIEAENGKEKEIEEERKSKEREEKTNQEARKVDKDEMEGETDKDEIEGETDKDEIEAENGKEKKIEEEGKSKEREEKTNQEARKVDKDEMEGETDKDEMEGETDKDEIEAEHGKEKEIEEERKSKEREEKTNQEARKIDKREKVVAVKTDKRLDSNPDAIDASVKEKDAIEIAKTEEKVADEEIKVNRKRGKKVAAKRGRGKKTKSR